MMRTQKSKPVARPLDAKFLALVTGGYDTHEIENIQVTFDAIRDDPPPPPPSGPVRR